MTRSPALIREIALAAIAAELFPRPDLLGAPRRPPWRLFQPSAQIPPVLQPAE